MIDSSRLLSILGSWQTPKVPTERYRLRALVKCGFANVQIFEAVKCREILRMLSADVMGKMRMWKCGYVTDEFMLKLLLIFVLHTASVLSYIRLTVRYD